jgi:DNA-binding GntR family transcriptional regulator
MRGDIDNAGYFAFFDALLERKLTLGQTLKQEELGEILGLSLSPMRETTTLLEAEGLISVRRRVGITIFYPDVRFVRETFQLRGLLEREGLRRFARRMPSDWIDEMRAAHEDIIAYVEKVHDEATYRAPVRALEFKFHGSFIGAYDNEEISAIYARLQRKMYLLRLLNAESVSAGSTVQAMREHLAIIDALGDKNADLAVDGLERHMRGVIHRTLD